MEAFLNNGRNRNTARKDLNSSWYTWYKAVLADTLREEVVVFEIDTLRH